MRRLHRRGGPFGRSTRARSVRAVAATALLLTSLVPAPAPRAQEVDAVSRWHAEIAEASERFGVPTVWIERVMRAESRGHTTLGGRPITSPAGAMGLMQLMPATWAELRGRLRLGSDPHQPRDNILAGTAYLREMYDKFGYPGLFAAYNAGPGRYAASRATGRPLPAETRAYLAAVAGGETQIVGDNRDITRRTAMPRSVPEQPPIQTIFITTSQARPEPLRVEVSTPASTPTVLPDPIFAVKNR